MITAAIALLPWLGLSPVLQQTAPSGAKIISNMLAHYHGLQSITGTINLLAEAKSPSGNTSANILTELQFEKPSKLFLKQTETGKHADVWVVTSDGVHFSYGTPENIKVENRSTRLVEVVDDANSNTHMDIAHIYGASVYSIGDRSAVLGIVLSWTDELRRIVADWPTVQLAGEVELNGTKAWKIVGKYKDTPGGGAVGDYVLVIDKAYNLLMYQTTQAIATPTDATHVDTKHPTYLIQKWTVTLEGDGKPNPALFEVLK